MYRLGSRPVVRIGGDSSAGGIVTTGGVRPYRVRRVEFTRRTIPAEIRAASDVQVRLPIIPFSQGDE
jgi:hypothetical protein